MTEEPKTTVLITTNMGTIEVELFPDKAPETVRNFLQYVHDGFYDGTIFHRVVPRFVIQGGGMTPDMRRKSTRPPIANEANNGLSNVRGTIAMARTSDPNSATSQFFISVKDNLMLDAGQGQAGYCVFGKVISGMEAVDRINAVETKGEIPVKPVVIESIKEN
jgi:cyclophilin family peptidyl-prolyl cis-trans isomerase